MSKRKTLPDNFSDIIDSGDMEKFRQVFEKCEITVARKGKNHLQRLFIQQFKALPYSVLG